MANTITAINTNNTPTTATVNSHTKHDATYNTDNMSKHTTTRREHMHTPQVLRDSIMHTVQEDETGAGSDARSTIRVTREKISRQASIGTAHELRKLPSAPRAGRGAPLLAGPGLRRR